MAPTVDDLRVKQCFICLEEERYDDPYLQTRRRWLHPCTCSLVAHEDCIKTWMFSSDSADEQQSINTHSCPQCRIPYELASSNPRIFDFTSKLESRMNQVGKYTTIATVTCTCASMLGLAYAPAAYYGAKAFKAIAGPAVYNTFLTNDPSKWPASAWLDLPLIPISLIASEFNFSTPYLTLLTMSAEIAGASFFFNWDSSVTTDILSSEVTRIWPPSTYAFTFLVFPIVNIAYHKLRAKILSKLVEHVLRKYLVLGTSLYDVRPPDEAIYEYGGRQRNARPGQRRGGGPEIRIEVEPRLAQGPGEPANEALRIPLLKVLNYGTTVLNALSMPFIASYMGSLLLRLSNHSSLLHAFLAPTPAGLLTKGPAQKGVLSLLSNLLGNSRSLELRDPVWWRNAVGLGIFIVARDVVGFVRMYLFYRRSFNVRFEDQPFRSLPPAQDMVRNFFRDLDTIR